MSTTARSLLLMILSSLACSPGTSEQAPGYLIVEPDVLTIQADSDSEALLVKNGGGKSLTFSIQVSATSNGIPWLEVDPSSAAIEGGGSRTVIVTAINRKDLEPGTYSGELVVSTPGGDSRKVLVDMVVGQPILTVDPSEELDFGWNDTSKNLIIKNTGDGELVYQVTLPGDWVTTESSLQNVIRPNEPQSMTLTIDREAVPWYGADSGELVIVSNGADNSAYDSTVRLNLKVEIDPACVNLGDCIKPGYYCQDQALECIPQADPGEWCELDVECLTGSCASSKCCTTVCEGPCESCSEPGHVGECIDLDDGAVCELPQAYGTCQAGGCLFDSCVDGWESCDDDLTDGCETDISGAPDSCGDCDTDCTKPHVIAGCQDGDCIVEGCEDDYGDCDDSYDNGCETDLASDADHCGQCSKPCLSESVDEVGVCQDKNCQTASCPEGSYNIDGNGANGCEATEVIWVNASNTDEDPTGSQNNPHPDIGTALSNASPGTAIFVANGLYAEGDLLITTDGTALVGESRDGVLLQVPAQSSFGLSVQADNVTVKNLSVQGGQNGIVVAGAPLEPLTNVALHNLLAYEQIGPESGQGWAAGVLVEHAENATVTALEVVSVTGGSGIGVCQEFGEDGQNAAGLAAIDCIDCSFQDITVSDIDAGAGGEPIFGGCDGPGGLGGMAAGIALTEVQDSTLNTFSVSDIHGGSGGGKFTKPAGWGGSASGIYLAQSSYVAMSSGTATTIAGGAGGMDNDDLYVATGGIAAGVRFAEESNQNSVAEVSIEALSGGPSAVPGNTATPQQTYGVYLANDSKFNTIAASVTLEEDEIVYLYKANGTTITNKDLQSLNNPTNWGIIAVVQSSNITITENVLSGHTGAIGLNTRIKGEPSQGGGPGHGVYLDDCINCSVTYLVLDTVTGGVGGHTPGATDGAAGGMASGIHVDNSTGVEVEENSVGTVVGGEGTGESTYKLMGAGGGAAAVALMGGQGKSLVRNQIREVVGGRGAGDDDAPNDERGIGGDAAGILLDGVAGGLAFSNNTVAKVSSGDGDSGAGAACVAVRNGGPVTVNHLTCMDAGTGVTLKDGTTPAVQLTNSILTTLSDACLKNLAGAATKLTASYSDLWSCGDTEAVDATVEGTCIAKDPKLESQPKGSGALLEDSPCIDAGDPLATCLLEPEPNGCFVNMGANGNTFNATSAIGAQHCQSCPKTD